MKIEISHDILAKKIFASIDAEDKLRLKVIQFVKDRYQFHLEEGGLLTRKDLNYIYPFLEEIELSEEYRTFIDKSKRKLFRRRILFFGIIGAILTILLLTSFLLLKNRGLQENLSEIERQNFLIEKQNREIIEKNTEIEKQRDSINTALILESNLRNRSDSLSRELEKTIIQLQIAIANAKEQELIAREKAKLEELQRQIADSLRIQASRQAERALEQEGIALKQRDTAQIAQNLAEESRQEAERLQQIALAKSLAIKSLALNDPRLKVLLSLAAYAINELNQGQSNDPDIFKSIFHAYNNYQDKFYNAIIGEIQLSTPIRGLMVDTANGNIYVNQYNSCSCAFAVYKLKNEWEKEMLKSPEVFVPDDYFYDFPKTEAEILKYNEHFIRSEDWFIDINYWQRKKNFFFKFNNQDYKTNEFKRVVVSHKHDGFFFQKQGKIYYSGLNSKKDLPLVPISKLGKSFGLSEDGKILVFYSLENKLSFYDTDKSKIYTVESVSINKPVVETSVSRFGINNFLIGMGYEDGKVDLIEVSETGDIIFTYPSLDFHKSRISSILFLKDQKKIAIGSYDQRVSVWDLEEFLNIGVSYTPIYFDDGNSWITALAYSPKSDQLLAGFKSGLIRVYNLGIKNYFNGVCELTRQYQLDSLSQPERSKYGIPNNISLQNCK